MTGSNWTSTNLTEICSCGSPSTSCAPGPIAASRTALQSPVTTHISSLIPLVERNPARKPGQALTLPSHLLLIQACAALGLLASRPTSSARLCNSALLQQCNPASQRRYNTCPYPLLILAALLPRTGPHQLTPIFCFTAIAHETPSKFGRQPFLSHCPYHIPAPSSADRLDRLGNVPALMQRGSPSEHRRREQQQLNHRYPLRADCVTNPEPTVIRSLISFPQ